MTAAVLDRRTVPVASLPTQRVRTEDPMVSAMPATMSPKQFASLKQSRAQLNIWTGAIRSGKTVSSLLRWLLYVRKAPTGGRLVMCGRTSATLYRNVFAVMQDPAIFGAMASEVHYTQGAPTATIFGREIDVIGANDAKAESKLRGLTCVGAYVDEITLLPREFWTQLIGRMSGDDAKLFGTTNPDNPAHWLRKDFLLRADTVDLNLRHWHFTIDDNPTLSARKKAQYRAQFTGVFFKRFILGLWVAAEGAIYDQFDEDVHVLRGPLPPIDRWLAVGIDYGTKNPFAALMLALTTGRDPRLVVTSEYRYDARAAHRSKTDAEYADDVTDWLARHPIPGQRRADPLTGTLVPVEAHGVRPEYIIIDPSAASFIQQMHDAGYSPAGANNSVLDGIRSVATLLARQKLFIHESCSGLLAEFPGYAWDDRESLVGRDVPIKADDHSLDALRYAVYTTETLWRPYVLEYA